jgi:hypothetical protein
MSVTLSHSPIAQPNILKYNYYRSDSGPGGPFNFVGFVNQPATPLPALITFNDPAGATGDYYRGEAVDLEGIPGQQVEVVATGTEGYCLVFDRLSDASGKPLVGVKVRARISKTAKNGNLIVPAEVEVTTRADGSWQMLLHPNAALEPDDTSYTFVIPNVSPSITGVIVPAEDSVEFKTLITLL